MIKVLVFSPIAVENGRGGEISSMELAAGLQEYFDVTFIHTNQLPGKKLLNKRAIENKLKNVKIDSRIKFAILKLSNVMFTFPYPWEILRLYKKVKKNDVIYTSFNNIKSTLLFIFFSLLHRRGKFIIGYRKPLYSEKIFSLYNLKYRISILLFSLFKNNFIPHTMSNYAKNYLEHFYKTDSVVHITHGIELDKYKDNGKEVKSDITLNFVYIGYLDDPHKGVGVLVDAIEKLLDENLNMKIFFEFCGMGPLESRLRELERKYPNYVKFHGYISNEEIPDYYKRNDVFLFTSRREPFPRVLMEALAAKLIIICSKTIGSIELLKQKAFSFFFRKLSPGAIKDRIVEVYKLWIKNPNRIKELQNSARIYIFNNYSFDIEIEEFKSLINRIYRY